MHLWIDNLPVTVPDGSTVLEAARAAGVEIPTLCYDPRCEPQHSCLVCVVKVNGSARLVPSCATRAAEGMRVESETPEVREARKTALELLLADHAGDCVAPCQGICPAKLDIPRMLAAAAEGRAREALRIAREALVLPGVLGCICPELCEKGCRRGEIDDPVAIAKVHRHVAEKDLFGADPWMPSPRPATGKRIAIVGAGPAGLAAAYYLAGFGHACTLLDDHDRPGGALRYAVDEAKLPRGLLDAEIAVVMRLGIAFRGGWKLGRDGSIDDLAREHDAVLLAIGPADAAVASALGLQAASKGIACDKGTMMTKRKGLFVAGAAVAPYKHAVRAVADARAAAAGIHQYLTGQPAEGGDKIYSVHIGKLRGEELNEVKVLGAQVSRAQADPRTGALAPKDCPTEAARCLHCACEADRSCALRRYAAQYGANQRRFNLPRRAVERVEVHPGIVYERGKCIACGLCVQVATRAGEELGLTWIGRGFDIRIGVPLTDQARQALSRCADACVDICPTGALAYAPILAEAEATE